MGCPARRPVERTALVSGQASTFGSYFCEPLILQESWRRRPDLNRGWRFCRPLPYLLATAPRKEQRRVNATRPTYRGEKLLERETGFEPATSTLARSHSTTELFPPEPPKYHTAGVPFKSDARLKPSPAIRSTPIRQIRTARKTDAASSGDVGLM